MKNWLSRLSEPFPLEISWPSFLKNAAIALVVVTLFLYFLRPFGAQIERRDEAVYFLTCLGYGLVAAVALMSMGLVLRFFPAFFSEKKWTLGREIGFQIASISLVGTGNWLYGDWLYGHGRSLGSWLAWQKMTALVAFAPIAVTAIFRQRRLKNRFETEAVLIQKNLSEKTQLVENQPVIASKIVLVGDNQGEKLEVERADFLYLEAADNYVEAHFLKGEKATSKLLRGTLKKMEEQLTGQPDLVRCHRAFLVNFEKVERVSGNAQGYKLHLEGASEAIPVSRNLNQLVAERLKN